MPKESAFIEDGYWLPGRIAGVPGLYPETRFEFRPARGPERRAFNNTPADQYDAAAAKLVLDRTRGFRFGADEQVYTLTPEQVNALQADIYFGLLNHALGHVGPDLTAEAKN
jgi:hypothetical protein